MATPSNMEPTVEDLHSPTPTQASDSTTPSQPDEAAQAQYTLYQFSVQLHPDWTQDDTSEFDTESSSHSSSLDREPTPTYPSHVKTSTTQEVHLYFHPNFEPNHDEPLYIHIHSRQDIQQEAAPRPATSVEHPFYICVDNVSVALYPFEATSPLSYRDKLQSLPLLNIGAIVTLSTLLGVFFASFDPFVATSLSLRSTISTTLLSLQLFNPFMNKTPWACNPSWSNPEYISRSEPLDASFVLGIPGIFNTQLSASDNIIHKAQKVLDEFAATESTSADSTPPDHVVQSFFSHAAKPLSSVFGRCIHLVGSSSTRDKDFLQEVEDTVSGLSKQFFRAEHAWLKLNHLVGRTLPGHCGIALTGIQDLLEQCSKAAEERGITGAHDPRPPPSSPGSVVSTRLLRGFTQILSNSSSLLEQLEATVTLSTSVGRDVAQLGGQVELLAQSVTEHFQISISDFDVNHDSPSGLEQLLARLPYLQRISDLANQTAEATTRHQRQLFDAVAVASRLAVTYPLIEEAPWTSTVVLPPATFKERCTIIKTTFYLPPIAEMSTAFQTAASPVISGIRRRIAEFKATARAWD